VVQPARARPSIEGILFFLTIFEAILRLLQEYFEEKPIREIYVQVVERLLLTLLEEAQFENARRLPNFILTNNEGANVWPPWPWPPWGGDDDENDGDKPVNRTLQIRKLAKGVVEFERKLAHASLDLYVFSMRPFCASK
jgi:endothelin-converting enzyme